MADTQILQAIQIIDDKIASLQEVRNRLASAFGVEDNPSTKSSSPAATQRILPLKHSNGHAPPSGRKVQLAEFLMTNGPMSRVAIVEKSGLPEGTISYCLSDKRFFEQKDTGDWNITEYSRKGLERKSKTGNFQMEQH